MTVNHSADDHGHQPTNGHLVAGPRFGAAGVSEPTPLRPWIEGRFEENVITTTIEQAINWARQVEHLADDVRPGLLRDRDDGGRGRAVTTWIASAPARFAPRRGRPT